MINSKDQLLKIFQGTLLADREIIEIPVLDTGECAFVIDISESKIELCWQIGHNALKQTGRWPILSNAWFGVNCETFSEAVIDADFFSRYGYSFAPNASDISPKAIISASNSANISKFLTAKEKKQEKYSQVTDCIHFEIDQTQHVTGKTPSQLEIQQATVDGKPITTRAELDRWLLEWELAHGGIQNPEMYQFEWFEPDYPVLLLLPTVSCWETLAYMNWFGASDYGTEYYISLGKYWQKQFGAKLVANYGTMLQCYVSNPPQTYNEAWVLAKEHDLIAGSLLGPSGISVRHYAAGLLNYNRWFLHDRP